jgi:hypothetical protein
VATHASPSRSRATSWDPTQIRRWIETLTGMELDAGGAALDLDARTWNERYDGLDESVGRRRLVGEHAEGS